MTNVRACAHLPRETLRKATMAPKRAKAQNGVSSGAGDDNKPLTEKELKELKTNGKGKAAVAARAKAKAASGGQSWLLRHAPLVAAAVLVQLVLTWGYISFWGSAAEPDVPPDAPPSGGGFKTAKPAVPAKCPADWPDCPAVGGADWEALAELEAAAAPPTEEELAGCEAAELLSPQRVPGMHLLCVLPAAAESSDGEGRPPSGAVGLRLAVHRDMDRRTPPMVLQQV